MRSIESLYNKQPGFWTMHPYAITINVVTKQTKKYTHDKMRKKFYKTMIDFWNWDDSVRPIAVRLHDRIRIDSVSRSLKKINRLKGH